MPLARNAVTLSFCQTGRPSSRMTAILLCRRFVASGVRKGIVSSLMTPKVGNPLPVLHHSRILFDQQYHHGDMDELDSAIVAALQADGRRSNRDLAAALGVSPSTTLERVRSLRERGVLAGVHYVVDPAQLGRPVQAMITVRLRPQSRAVVLGFRNFAVQLP